MKERTWRVTEKGKGIEQELLLDIEIRETKQHKGRDKGRQLARTVATLVFPNCSAQQFVWEEESLQFLAKVFVFCLGM